MHIPAIELVAAPIPPAYQLEPPPPTRSFADVLLQTAREVEKADGTMERLVGRAMRNELTPPQLLVLQYRLHRYSLQMELLSKSVQQIVQGLREVLKTQV